MSAEIPRGIIDADLEPYAEPLGTLIIAFGRAEANLIDLVNMMQGKGPVEAFKLLNKNKPEKIINAIFQLVENTPLKDEEKSDIKSTIKRFWDARSERHRLVHDDWFPDWDQHRGLVIGLFGRIRNSENTIVYTEPNIEDMYILADIVSRCGQSFSFYYHAIAEETRHLSSNAG